MTDSVQETRLRALIESEKKILKAQEYQDGTIKNRRADYMQVRTAIDQLRAAGVTLPEERSADSGVTANPKSKRVVLLD